MMQSATRSAPHPATGLALPASAPPSARALFALLRRLRVGTLDVQLPDGQQLRFGSGAASEPQAAVRLHNWQVCGAALRAGDIGFAESFIAGDWAASDLVALLTLFIANRAAVESMVYGTWWGNLIHRVRHLLNRKSRAGSKRNIHAHYDLGNAFYRLWLDPTMSYSSAWFSGNLAQTTASAQQAKIRRALAECQLQPGDRVLEIGCGWGGLAECATRDFGAHLTGVTLSAEQLGFGQQRLADAGMAERARPRRDAMALAGLVGLLLAAGFAALFYPPAGSPGHLLAWCAATLVVTCLGYSSLGVLHQAWGARLGGGPVLQARVVAWREGLALAGLLAGVLAASVLPALAGIPVIVATACALLVLGLWALAGALYRPAQPRLAAADAAAAAAVDIWLPWRVPAFRQLMAVFLLNGVASAIPATLVLFFIRDRLQAAAWEPAFLGGYFVAAAVSMPLWVRAVSRWGLLRCWLAGMGLAVAAFVWAARLGSGDSAAFALICGVSGAAFGAAWPCPAPCWRG